MLFNIATFCKNNKIIILSSAVTCVGIYGIRRWLAGAVCQSKSSLAGKVIVITGSNSGIGAETALECGKRGAKVIIACRDILRAERTAQHIRDSIKKIDKKEATIIVQQLDLANLESVRKCATHLLLREPKIDILVNNAGVMACPEWKSADGFELQFATNHLGHFLLTNLLLESLKAAGKPDSPARVVTVSSIAHEKGKIHFDNINLENEYHSMEAYRQSKLANILFTAELAKRCDESGDNIVAYSLHPGVISNDLMRHIVPTMSWWQIKLLKLVSLIFTKNSKQGAQTSLFCILEDNLPTGKYFSDCRLKMPAPQAQNMEDAKHLWELSAQLVKL